MSEDKMLLSHDGRDIGPEDGDRDPGSNEADKMIDLFFSGSSKAVSRLAGEVDYTPQGRCFHQTNRSAYLAYNNMATEAKGLLEGVKLFV